MTGRLFWILGCIFALTAVAAGAFGAHALRDRLPVSLLAIYETAARYQMYHALALIAVAWLLERSPGRAAKWAGVLFAIGIVLFSGSLYILSVFEVRIMGAVAPLGGLAFLGGWLCFGLAAWRTSAKA